MNYLSIISGRKRASLGKIVIRMTMANMDKRKGATPLKIVSTGVSFATPATVKMLSPMGGVISPASIIRTAITPNHIGLKPRARITGKITGMVNTIIDMASKKHPRKR
jgi:hypothetical protein